MRIKSLAALMLGGLYAAAASSANVYVETGDAGQTIATAQAVNTLVGGTALDAIQGTLSSGADLFKIYLTGGQAFSATTTASSIAFNNFDTELFLFNSLGLGVYANDDDASAGGGQSTLPAGPGFAPTASGVYYLGIAGTGYLPVSTGGQIFGAFFSTTNVVGPSGPGGGAALSNWSSVSSESGAYQIVLTGAQFLPSAVPEPPVWTLMLFGGIAAGAAAPRLRASRQGA